MNFFKLKTAALWIAITGIVWPALAVASVGAAATPSHPAVTLPPALRPAFYRVLNKDAGSGDRFDKNGCATLPTSPLKACFNRHGAHFSGDNALSLRLAAYGRGGKLTAVKSVKPIIEGNQVSYPHGALTAWWRVLPMGFEQGFTVTKRPAGHGELTLVLAASGQDTSAPSTRHSRESGNPAETTITWSKLRYGKLIVTDAKGRIIPATLKSNDEQIFIAIHDSNASYPLIVDPVVWLKQKITPTDGTSFYDFGNAVAIFGTTAVVGADFTSNPDSSAGAVYVFSQTNGKWIEQQQIVPNDGARDFGASVAFDGETLVVGSTPNAYSSGGVYVYTQSNGTWTLTQKLTAGDAGIYSGYGVSVAVSGNTILVGAPTLVFPNQYGGFYVYTRSNDTWTQTQEIKGSIFYGLLGRSLAISGSVAVVGQPGGPVSPAIQGHAYIYTKLNDNWTRTELTSSDGVPGDNFGASVAIDGTTALVGAPQGCFDCPGFVYVFTESAGNWSQAQKLMTRSSTTEDLFGDSVALNDGTAIVGAPSAAITDSSEEQGALYVFTGSPGSLDLTQTLTLGDTGQSGNFGFGTIMSLAQSGVVAGDPFSGNGGTGTSYYFGRANLELTVTDPITVAPGANYTSKTLVTNIATAQSPAVALTVSVPSAASFISAIASQGICTAETGVVTCDFGSINGNSVASASIKFRATGASHTVLANKCAITDAQPPLTATAAISIDNPPVAEDGTLMADQNTSASGTLKATDPDGDALVFSIVDKPTHGSVKLNDASTGAYTYKPDQGYSGSDSFTFKANDGQADSNTAKTTITIKTVNQPPVATDGTLTTTENTAASGTLQASDPDGGHLTFAIVTSTAHGKVDLSDDGAYTYTPNHGYSGRDSFTFKANDGQADSNLATISITVKTASPPPPPSGGGGGATGPLGLGLLGLAALLAFLSRRH